jgi:hypothetical protein
VELLLDRPGFVHRRADTGLAVRVHGQFRADPIVEMLAANGRQSDTSVLQGRAATLRRAFRQAAGAGQSLAAG